MLDSKNLQFLSRTPCRPAVLLPHTQFCWNRTIGRWFMAKKAIFKMAAAAIFNFKNFNFWSRDCNRFTIWCSIPNFIKIGQFFTEIWRFYDFQNGGRPPSWILKICIFRFVALVCMPFCFLMQNFAEIGQSVRWFMAKKSIFKMAAAAILNFKNCNFWSRDCHRVQYLL